LSQQKGSRLRPTVRNESQKGKSQFFERIGSVVAQQKTGRHSDTPQIDTPHSRRRVTLLDFVHADLIDREDLIRTLIDPDSQYSQAFMWALGRVIDDRIIRAIRGDAFSGEDGSTVVPLPLTQQLMAFELGTADAIVPTRLNFDTLLAIKDLFDTADVDPSIRRYIAVNSRNLRSLLEEDKLTSSDFATVKALVRGELDEFLGFTFIRTERIVSATNLRDDIFFDDTALTGGDVVASVDGTLTNPDHCVAWASDGIVLSIGQDMIGRIEERADKNFATQVFASMSIGSTRLEEVMAVDIACLSESSVVS